MPKVLGYTPAWLSKPSPGARIFSDPEPQSPASPSKTKYSDSQDGSAPSKSQPTKLIASRGSEIFIVVGNKIRWTNFSQAKGEWEDEHGTATLKSNEEPYRTLVTPVFYQITRLLISPSGAFMAICTDHTIHIAVLPDSSRLADQDRSPLKLKAYQLGPTTHVIPEAPLASILWHPLAVSTNSTDCLVTVTTEAAVRVWELDRANHWSFEQPALAIDLRRLADGVSSDQDFEPSTFGKSRGFSVDAVDMEVSACCFGGRGSPDEDGWAAMTLWTAMSNGDIYALCPLLPSLWRPSASTIPSLSISSVTKVATLDDDDEEDDRNAAQQQYEWVQELDNEDMPPDTEYDEEIRIRPQNPSAIPRLQGPFELNGMSDDDEVEIADIYVVAARLDEEALLSGEDDYEVASDGIQYTTIFLASTDNRVHISLELEGVSGQWLPKQGRSTFSVPVSEASVLVPLEILPLGDRYMAPASLVFTSDLYNAYSLFLTTSSSIFSISIADWASRVGAEINGDGHENAGLHTRLQTLCHTSTSVKMEIISRTQAADFCSASTLSAPVLLSDFELGDMLVSFADGHAYAATLDYGHLSVAQSHRSKGHVESPPRINTAAISSFEQDVPDAIPVRSPYSPAGIFYANQMQPYEALRSKVPATRKSILTEKPIRLSPACLDIMTLAHKTFSSQTADLEKAASELFRKCERLRDELADQVRQMAQIAKQLHDTNTDFESGEPKKNGFEQRLVDAQSRQQDLLQRYEAARRKSARIGLKNHELTIKEKIWIDEIENLGRHIGLENENEPPAESVFGRYEVARSLAQDLIERNKTITSGDIKSPTRAGSQGQPSPGTPSKRSGMSVSSKLQLQGITDAMTMVERESAVIDAVMNRLQKLSAL